MVSGRRGDNKTFKYLFMTRYLSCSGESMLTEVTVPPGD